MSACLFGDGVEIGLHVGDFEDGEEELGVGFACEWAKSVLWEEEIERFR